MRAVLGRALRKSILIREYFITCSEELGDESGGRLGT